jgi:hypothetical protein
VSSGSLSHCSRNVSAPIGEGWAQATKEEAERAGGIGEQGKAGIGDRRGKLNRIGPQRPHVAQRLSEFDGGVGAYSREGDQPIAAVVQMGNLSLAGIVLGAGRGPKLSGVRVGKGSAQIL